MTTGISESNLGEKITFKGGFRHIISQNRSYKTVKTGHKALDQNLQLGGWVLGASTEIGLENNGIGELRLLFPALKEVVSSAAPYTICVAPPYPLFAPALEKSGVDLKKLIVIQPSSTPDLLWSIEQALLVDSCAAVFCWTGKYNLTQRETRRLQLAAEKSNTWFVQFRHRDCLNQASAARLRLNLAVNRQHTLDVSIIKQPHGYAGQQCTISLAPHYEHWQRFSVNRLPQYNRSANQARLQRQGSSY